MKLGLVLGSLLIGATIAALAAASGGAQVNLSWTKPVNTATYKVYIGTRTRYYTTALSVGSATNTTITGLARKKTYFFAVTGISTNSLESSFSNEITVKTR